jgi:hypothetical protein
MTWRKFVVIVILTADSSLSDSVIDIVPPEELEDEVDESDDKSEFADNRVVQTSPTPAPTWCPIWTVFVKLRLKLGHKVGICKLDSGALFDASTLVS